MGLSLCAAARQEDHKTTEEVFGSMSTVKDISQNDVKACFGTNCTTYRKVESPDIRKKIRRQKRKLESLQRQLTETRGAKRSRNKISQFR
jgi:hypothetical protein